MDLQVAQQTKDFLLNFGLPIVADGISRGHIAQIPAKQASEMKMLLYIYNRYQAILLSLQGSLREVSEEHVETLKDHCQYLKIQESSQKYSLELGDRVKIILKHRQFKQIAKQSGWNEMMKQERYEIGTVIGLKAPDASIAIVFFQKSNNRWAIHQQALKKVSILEESESHSNLHLKIGDNVQIDQTTPDYAIRTLQAFYNLSDIGVLQHRRSLRKILAFQIDGTAIVSINDYESIFVHPNLLRKVDPNCTRKISKQTPGSAERLQWGHPCVIKKDIKELIKYQGWNYSFTKILGKSGRIIYNDRGLYGVEIGKESYLLPPHFILKKFTKRNKTKTRHATQEGFKTNERYPFYVDTLVKLQLASSNICERMLKELNLPLQMLPIIDDEIAIVRGYHFEGIAMIEFEWPSLVRATNISSLVQVFVDILQKISSKTTAAIDHLKWQDTYSNMKVGDRVSLFGAKYPNFVQKILEKINVADDIKEAMTSNAQLVAFDDDKDEVILKYDNGKIFACPSSFITTSFDETKSQKENLPAELEQGCLDLILDLFLQIKTVISLALQRLGIEERIMLLPQEFSYPNILLTTLTLARYNSYIYENFCLVFNEFKLRFQSPSKQCFTFYYQNISISMEIKTEKAKSESKITELSNTSKFQKAENFDSLLKAFRQQDLFEPKLQADCGDEPSTSRSKKSSKEELSRNNMFLRDEDSDLESESSKRCIDKNDLQEQLETASLFSANFNDNEEREDESIFNNETDTNTAHDEDNELNTSNDCNQQERSISSALDDLQNIQPQDDEISVDENPEFQENAYEEADPGIPRPATITINPRTREVIMRGMLDGGAENPRPAHGRYSRQASTAPQPNDGTVGGPKEIYYFNNCNFQGNTMIGNSPFLESSYQQQN